MAGSVELMDVHSVILLLVVASSAAGFVLGRLSGSPQKQEQHPQRQIDNERKSFFQFTQLVLDVLPVLLRKYFKARWHTTYDRMWSDTEEDGAAFWWGTFDENPCAVATVTKGSTLAVPMDGGLRVQTYGVRGMAPGDHILIADEMYKVVSLKPNILHLSRPARESGTFPVRMQSMRGERNADSRMRRYFEPKVLKGDVRDWDLSLLCFALLYSSHNLIPIGDDARQLVEELRDLRNNKLAHVERCAMDSHELARAVEIMNRFVEGCMPNELELWNEASRGILSGHPLEQQSSTQECLESNGRFSEPYIQLSGQEDDREADWDQEDSISISVCPEAQDFHTLMDRMTTQQQLRFMDEWKARWLTEFSAMATTKPLATFSCASVRFTR